eukprot:CAMPEP_0115833504 /NCGR_PEP_ID=MMETSP0287-20121206/3207_1 /TAXON_ID=412157 /ORGANISM="Chrysochromulina rotalis, Strain UIO044" /LENGTH=147 /DNA_ID=CAMNT_0003286921 /DNA_START=286 /DNA_END=725 /DNA_ORIENTATION=-
MIIRIRRRRLDSLYGGHACDDAPKDDMPSVEVWRPGRGDVELTMVGVTPRVGHAQQPGLAVFRLEALVRKEGAIDGRASRPIAANKVASLDHQSAHDAMDGAPLVVHRLARERMNAAVAADEATKVLRRLGQRARPQLEHHALGRRL